VKENGGIDAGGEEPRGAQRHSLTHGSAWPAQRGHHPRRCWDARQGQLAHGGATWLGDDST
jgi:hypothetical protein